MDDYETRDCDGCNCCTQGKCHRGSGSDCWPGGDYGPTCPCTED